MDFVIGIATIGVALTVGGPAGVTVAVFGAGGLAVRAVYNVVSGKYEMVEDVDIPQVFHVEIKFEFSLGSGSAV